MSPAPEPESPAAVSRHDIEEFFVCNYDELARKVRSKVRTAEPHRWVNEAFIAACETLLSLNDSDLEGHLAARTAWTSGPYIVKVAVGRFIDDWRHNNPHIGTEDASGRPIRAPRETPVDPEPEDGWSPLEAALPWLTPDHPDQVPARLIQRDRRRAVSTVLRVLVQRGLDSRLATTSISPGEWLILQHLATLPAAGANPAGADEEEGYRRTMQAQRRARERWAEVVASLRAGRGWPSLHNGDEAAVAEALHVNRSTINRRLAHVRQTISLTRYVAGVLAPEGTLLDARRIRFHLDTFDALRRSAADQRELLSSAAPHVRTTEHGGTRVDAAAFEAAHLAGTDELHRAETEFAAATITPHPNCVSLCDAHNPTPHRATEI